MVIPFLQNMAQNFEQLGGITGSRLIGSAIDLITTMLADELDLDAAPSDGHVLLMHEIRRYVDVNLARPDLGPAADRRCALHLDSPPSRAVPAERNHRFHLHS